MVVVEVVEGGRVRKSLKESPVTKQIAIRPKPSVFKENIILANGCELETTLPKTLAIGIKEVYKRPGKGSRTRCNPPLRVYHKPLAAVEDHTSIFRESSVEMLQNGTKGLRAHVKRELELAIIKTTRSWISSATTGHIVAVGENKVFEVDVIFGKLFSIVKRLETVTGTTCPHPAVLGGFLLGQQESEHWYNMVWAGYVSPELKETVDAYAVGVAVRAGVKLAGSDQ